jgi:23S rRNA (adenine2503-C2)-methyltransferase
MPASAPIAESIQLLNEYRIRTGCAVEVHYTLIATVNDSIGDGHALRTLLGESKIPVKFLKLNPVKGDVNCSPDWIWVRFFRSLLEDHGIQTEWYDSPGADIAAACGMFATDMYLPAHTPEETPAASPGCEEAVPNVLGPLLINMLSPRKPSSAV